MTGVGTHCKAVDVLEVLRLVLVEAELDARSCVSYRAILLCVVVWFRLK